MGFGFRAFDLRGCGRDNDFRHGIGLVFVQYHKKMKKSKTL